MKMGIKPGMTKETFLMFLKLLLSIILTANFIPLATNQAQVLGWQNTNSTEQRAGDSLATQTPQRINPNNLGPVISAQSAVVVDKNSGQILWSKNAAEKKSIASITKLMTAIVFLNTNPDLKSEFYLTQNDIAGGSKLNILIGEHVSLENLLNLTLVNSDNSAALAIIRASGMTKDEFVKKMNEKAEKNNLWQTNFSDPVGLSDNNISTAEEVAKLLNLALKNNLIQKILAQKNYSFTSLSGKTHHVKNTNELLNSYLNVQAGKTGYTDKARYCFVSLIKLKNNAEIITVVLDAQSDQDRFQDTKVMAEWVKENYQW